MTTPDPAAIARGLSELEKEAIKNYWCFTMDAMKPLIEKGVLSSYFPMVFTPLGVAVREELLRKDSQ